MGYQSIMTDNFEHCYICGRRASDIHHILHGADKKLSEELGFMVPLCRECHNRVHHSGGDYDLLLKQDAQRAYLIKTCGRCYL